MELEKQVCSLEISKELKELGVKQESLWYWWYGQMSKNWRIHKGLDFNPQENGKDRFGVDIYSAFTCSELGELLPIRIGFSADKSKELGYESMFLSYEFIGKDNSNYKEVHMDRCNVFYKPFSVYKKNSLKSFICWEQGTTEANARGKMLIYLIKEGLWTPVKNI